MLSIRNDGIYRTAVIIIYIELRATIEPQSMEAYVQEIWEQNLKFMTDGWTLKFGNSKAKAGLCNCESQTITISRYFLISADRNEILNVVLHEIAHAVVGPYVEKPHGVEWRGAALKLGCDARIMTKPFTQRKYFKYLILCGKGCVLARENIQKRGYIGRKCLEHGLYMKAYFNTKYMSATPTPPPRG